MNAFSRASQAQHPVRLSVLRPRLNGLIQFSRFDGPSGWSASPIPTDSSIRSAATCRAEPPINSALGDAFLCRRKAPGPVARAHLPRLAVLGPGLPQTAAPQARHPDAR